MKRSIINRLVHHFNISNTVNSRFLSTIEAAERRSAIFTLEKKRQKDSVGRIEKIEVQYKGIPKDATLIMNKDLSTPHDCAMHMSQWHAETSALAIVDDDRVWDMHRPLTDNCTLQFKMYTSTDLHHVNKAFWRTCSLLLGACATVAFKPTVPVHLHSFPGPEVRSGSFLYDIELPTLGDWSPTELELRSLSAEFVRLCRRGAPLERLEVSELLAAEMFKDNAHKSKQIPDIAAKSDGKVTLYRVGNHVDISRGPLVNNVNQIGRATVTAVHRISGEESRGGASQLHRFQGVALPTGVILDHFAYGILEERARKLNPTRTPYDLYDENGPTRQAVSN